MCSEVFPLFPAPQFVRGGESRGKWVCMGCITNLELWIVVTRKMGLKADRSMIGGGLSTARYQTSCVFCDVLVKTATICWVFNVQFLEKAPLRLFLFKGNPGLRKVSNFLRLSGKFRSNLRIQALHCYVVCMGHKSFPYISASAGTCWWTGFLLFVSFPDSHGVNTAPTVPIFKLPTRHCWTQSWDRGL